DQMRLLASSWCPNVGLSSAPSRGSIDAVGSPKIGRTSIARRSHSCASLQFASCSEKSAIRTEVFGQTLSDKMPSLRSSVVDRVRLIRVPQALLSKQLGDALR